VNAQAWLVEFGRPGAAAMAAERVRIAQRIAAQNAAQHESDSPPAPAPVVLVSERVSDSRLDDLPTNAAAVLRTARAHGWQASAYRSIAIVAAKGLVRVATIRASRHDERLWCGWWHGDFQHGWYFSAVSSIEALGWARLPDVMPGPAPVQQLTVKVLGALIRERGGKIRAGARRDDLVEMARELGITSAPVPPPRRGVLDAIEGIQLSRDTSSGPGGIGR